MTRERAQEVNGCGIAQIIDGWANVIADAFVKQTRFDPLHAAATEQKLYDLVSGWMGSNSPAEVVAIEHNDQSRRLELNVEDLSQKLKQRLQSALRLLQPDRPVVLGPNALQVPLLGELLSSAGHTVSTVSTEQFAANFARLAPISQADGVVFETSLPHLGEAVAQVVEARPALLSPTHGLHDLKAVPIGSQELPAEAVANAQLGEVVEVNGCAYQLIHVRP